MDSCPRPDVLSSWAKGPLPEEAVSHLAGCEPCRSDLVQVRRLLDAKGATEAVRAPLKTRLYGLTPVRRFPYVWIAAAAVVLVAILAAVLHESPAPTPAPKPIVAQPSPKPKPPPAPLAPEVRPEPPVLAKPEPPPEKAPAPLPEPPKPAPPELPVVVKPAPEPEKPAPVPEKPAPALTRARLRGSLTAIAGSASVQIDSDAWQSVKIAQARDFMGVVKVKADVAPAKFRVGATTCYVQRGGELALTLEEGLTHVRLARGEAFFDVTPGRDPFEVEMPLGTVAVKGTRFLVSESDVAVQRGAVQLNSILIAAGERSTGAAAQKADLTKRLAWLRTLEDTLTIETDTMALAGGLTILPDPTASGGRAIGIKDPLKPGQEAVAEIRAKRKQPAPYAVWIRLHWAHNVPSSLSLAVGDTLKWTSKDVAANPQWQWVRAGAAELPDEAFRIRLTDTNPGMRIDQVLITSDLEWNPENK